MFQPFPSFVNEVTFAHELKYPLCYFFLLLACSVEQILFDDPEVLALDEGEPVALIVASLKLNPPIFQLAVHCLVEIFYDVLVGVCAALECAF